MGQLTYTTQEVQDKLDAVGTLVRPNLLDNAYFIGGGSQQGGGQFPINQRGQTTYSHPGSYLSYTIDRWIFRDNSNTGHNVVLTANGLQMNYTGTAIGGFSQAIEHKEDLLGKTITISALMENVTGAQCRLGIFLSSIAGAHTESIGTVDCLGGGLISSTITLPSTIAYDYMMVGFFTNENKGFTGLCKAVKLEVGDTQTLAHWDEDSQAWVLNEVPKYEEELAKCQRFAYVNSTGSSQFIRADYTSTNTIYYCVNPPVPMRSAVTYTVLSSGGLAVKDMSNNSVSGFAFTIQNLGALLRITATKTSHGLADSYLNIAKTLFSSDM